MVCRSVRLSVTIVSPAKTAEPIEMPFGIGTWAGPRNRVLGGRARWRHLFNTVAPSMCGSDAAFSQITLTTSTLVLVIYKLQHCLESNERMPLQAVL